MAGESATAPANVEEWAEDDGGFFSAFAEEAAGGFSRRKRNRQAHEQEVEQQQAVQRAEATEDEAIVMARAEEARRQIAAKVFSRASPREVRQALKKAKKESIPKTPHGEGDKARQCKFSSLQKRQKKRRK
ncbi:hypothetical protein BCY84_14093 [Trypanosoma cruzi cruzi]|nr:hypothetical protein BCY84_14093 [Trypanosoma cruzi cruzi]